MQRVRRNLRHVPALPCSRLYYKAYSKVSSGSHEEGQFQLSYFVNRKLPLT